MPVDIDLDAKTKLTSDRWQWILNKRCESKKTGDVTWAPFAYCKTLDSALRCYAETATRMSDAKSVVALMKVYGDTMTRIERLVAERGLRGV